MTMIFISYFKGKRKGEKGASFVFKLGHYLNLDVLDLSAWQWYSVTAAGDFDVGCTVGKRRRFAANNTSPLGLIKNGFRCAKT